ncbi:response regulator transcription factor [Alistipes senegalensis]|uniref:response regulator transcription factor n=1 Tax=Alistipes senegalensis TaxID=1288121 RepID=UPI0035271105
MKVLIIEDEPSLRSLMSEELRRAGYVVQEAETFGDATLKLRLYEYDCILLDIMLPDGSGLRILEELEAPRRLSPGYRAGQRAPRPRGPARGGRGP